jgi:hypothetical protein
LGRHASTDGFYERLRAEQREQDRIVGLDIIWDVAEDLDSLLAELKEGKSPHLQAGIGDTLTRWSRWLSAALRILDPS